MRKIKLELENLRVETFIVTPEPREDGGTVFAHDSETRRSERPFECTMETTCGVTCTGEEMRTEEFTICECEQQP